MLDVKTSLQNNSNIKEYVSGVNGSKNMTFRTGNKGIMVKIGNNKNGQWNNLHGILAYKDFVWMSFIFKIIYGFSPVQEGTMMDRWQKAFINRPKFQPQQSASNQYQQPNNVSMPNQYQQFAVPDQYQIPAGY